MAKAVDIRPLAREDDRRDFSCGQADLDRFFEHYARQNQFKLHLAVTCIAGCVGGVTDVKPEAAPFYEALGFIALEGLREGLMVGEPRPMFIGIDVIAAAIPH